MRMYANINIMIAVLLGCMLSSVSSRFTEAERIANWHAHFTWPPNFNNESDGYRRLMEQREREIMALPGSDERWYTIIYCIFL